MQLRFDGGEKDAHSALLSETRSFLDAWTAWAPDLAQLLLENDEISNWHSHPWRLSHDDKTKVHEAIQRICQAYEQASVGQR